MDEYLMLKNLLGAAARPQERRVLIEWRRSLRSQTITYFTVRQKSATFLPAIRSEAQKPIGHTRPTEDAHRLHRQSVPDSQRARRSKVHLKTARHLDMQSRDFFT